MSLIALFVCPFPIVDCNLCLLLNERNSVEIGTVVAVGVAPDADGALSVGHIYIVDLDQLIDARYCNLKLFDCRAKVFSTEFTDRLVAACGCQWRPACGCQWRPACRLPIRVLHQQTRARCDPPR